MPRESVKQLRTQVDDLTKRLEKIDPLYKGDAVVRYIGMDGVGSIRYPRSGGASAGFGDTITDSDRLYAVQREPIAYRVTVVVANDAFDKWFTVDDPGTEAADPDLDGKVQQVLRDLQAKSVLSNALASERIYGYSLVVGAFTDAESTTDHIKPLTTGAELVDMAVYSKPMVTSIERDPDPESLRFGLPIVYNINRGSGKRLRVHYTRVINLQTTSDATSVLDPIWDDLTNGRNIRWGMGQTMFRYGSGFPVLTLTGKTIEQLQEYADAGYFTNLMARTQLLKNDQMDIEFKGMQGAALNPEPYYKPILENISVGTGIPEAILRGVQAGALTGSEVNEREYFKVISSIQSKVEPYLRQLIQWILPQAGVEPDKSFEINWVSGFQPSEKDQATIDLLKEQTKQIKLQYMTPDEIREEEGLDPLPNGEGATLKKVSAQSGFGAPGNSPEVIPPEGQAPTPESLIHDQLTMNHPTLVTALKDIAVQVHEKQISKANALEKGGRIIKLFVSQEQQRAMAYVGAKAHTTVIHLPYEQQRLLDEQLRQYLKDWEAMVDAAIKAKM